MQIAEQPQVRTISLLYFHVTLHRLWSYNRRFICIFLPRKPSNRCRCLLGHSGRTLDMPVIRKLCMKRMSLKTYVCLQRYHGSILPAMIPVAGDNYNSTIDRSISSLKIVMTRYFNRLFGLKSNSRTMT